MSNLIHLFYKLKRRRYCNLSLSPVLDHLAAFFCNFSSSAKSFLRHGDQNCTQYSKCGCTIDVYNSIMILAMTFHFGGIRYAQKKLALCKVQLPQRAKCFLMKAFRLTQSSIYWRSFHLNNQTMQQMGSIAIWRSVV